MTVPGRVCSSSLQRRREEVPVAHAADQRPRGRRIVVSKPRAVAQGRAGEQVPGLRSFSRPRESATWQRWGTSRLTGFCCGQASRPLGVPWSGCCWWSCWSQWLCGVPGSSTGVAYRFMPRSSGRVRDPGRLTGVMDPPPVLDRPGGDAARWRRARAEPCSRSDLSPGIRSQRTPAAHRRPAAVRSRPCRGRLLGHTAVCRREAELWRLVDR